MRRLKRIAAVLWLIGCAGAAPASAQMSAAQLQAMYTGYLQSEGCAPSLDEDGDVRFKKDGFTFIIIVDAHDPGYFHLMFPNFWEIESEEELAAAYRAASTASRKVKVAKVWVRKDEQNVSATTEILLQDPADFKIFLPRLIASLRQAADYFVEALEKGREVTI